MITDWRREIAIAWYVQNETSKLDSDGLWNYFLPKVAATEEELQKAECAIGHPLDPRYREFLTYANGWRCFLQHVDLFGTAELSGGTTNRLAASALDEIAPESFIASAIVKSDLLPIGFSHRQSDLFLMPKPNSANRGSVIWFAGEEIQRFPTFDEFFLAMVDYNRLRYNSLSSTQTGKLPSS